MNSEGPGGSSQPREWLVIGGHKGSVAEKNRKGHILETVGKKANSVMERMSQRRALNQSKITLKSALLKRL